MTDERTATDEESTQDELDELYADLAHVETFLATAALTPTFRRVYAAALREIRRRIAEAGGDPNAV